MKNHQFCAGVEAFKDVETAEIKEKKKKKRMETKGKNSRQDILLHYLAIHHPLNRAVASLLITSKTLILLGSRDI